MRYAHIPNTHSPSQPAPGKLTRAGFTLVELLVVIAIIGMLVALLIPAVGAARRTARKAACLSNIGQIGKGIINFETSKGRYPGYVEAVQAVGGPDAPKNYVGWTPGATGTEFVDSRFELIPASDSNARLKSKVAWSALILPYVDRQDLWDIIQDGAATNEQRVLRKVDVYVCGEDSDLTSLEDPAGLSYVANTGAWDWDGTDFNGADNTNLGEAKENGLLFNMVRSNIKSRLSGVRDGGSMTLLLAENMNKSNYSWFGVDWEDPNALGEQQFGMVWVATTQPSDDCSDAYSQRPLNDDADIVTWPSDVPCFARPYSNHSGGAFNVVFADGHGGSINPDIDYMVYQALLTSHGAKCIDPGVASGDSPTGEITLFRQRAPLSESDFD